MSETYDTLNIDARILAGIGVRTIFDRASEVLDIDPAITFKEKVNGLVTKGTIRLEEKEHLDVLTEAGGAAPAHRAWEPSVEELHALMDIMETFIYRAFVLTKQVAIMKAGIPPKQARQKVVPSATE